MRAIILVLLVLICLLPLSAARKALIIGNGTYSDVPLKNPVNDATDIAAALRNLKFDEVTLQTNADLKTLEETINRFAAGLSSNDEVVFYYSGHGVQVRGDNYLVPVGVSVSNEYDCVNRCYAASTALGQLSSAKVNVFILDACRDNPFKGIRSSAKGLAQMASPEEAQYMIVYATKSGSVALDNLPGNAGNRRNSPFAQVLLSYLENPQDEIGSLMRKVSADVYNLTRKQQDPWISSNLKTELYLASVAPVKPAQPNRTEPQSQPQPQPSQETYRPSAQPASLPGMVYVDGGSFQMGSDFGESDETPVHRVTVSSFYIGKYEVTVGEFRAFINATGYQTTAELEGGAWAYENNNWVKKSGVRWSNPGFTQNDNHPVTCVSWYDVISYCNWRSQQEGLTPCYTINKNSKDSNNQNSSDNYKWTVTCNWSANGYRLPTEAEWEYAARGGNQSKGYKYSGSNTLGDVAWYRDNSEQGYSDSQTHPVGQKQANELGIYDMSGNVLEWCWDWYDSSYYGKSPDTNPQGAGAGDYRLLRGGGWHDCGDDCRVAYRSCNSPGRRYYDVGFRLLRAM